MPRIHSLVPHQLPGYDWASCPGVPVVQCFFREVVVLPPAKDISGDGVKVVTAVLVAVIVVVEAGEAAWYRRSMEGMRLEIRHFVQLI